MWCWQVKDVNVANTNEAGSLQRSIKSMCYKSCELLPTMIAAGLKWLQHSGHSPAQKFSTLHLLRPQVCQTAKFTAGRCPEQAMSISPHQQQIQRGWTCISNMLAQEHPPNFPVGCSDAINNAILWAVHPVSLSHQAREARWHPGSWLADGCQCWPLIGQCHPQPPPLSHLSPASLQLLPCAQIIVTLSSASHLGEDSELTAASRLADVCVWKCLNWLNSLLIVFRQ